MIKDLFLFVMDEPVDYFGGMEPVDPYLVRVHNTVKEDSEFFQFCDKATEKVELAREFVRSWEKKTGMKVAFIGVIQIFPDPLGQVLEPCVVFKTVNNGQTYVVSAREDICLPAGNILSKDTFNVEELNLPTESKL